MRGSYKIVVQVLNDDLGVALTDKELTMTGRDTTVTLGQVLDVLEAARDAGWDVGQSIQLLQELITENPQGGHHGIDRHDDGQSNPRSEWCQCGHVEEAHNRRRRSQDCALCRCGKFRPG